MRIRRVFFGSTTKVSIGIKSTHRCQPTTPLSGLCRPKQYYQIGAKGLTQTVHSTERTIRFLNEMMQGRVHVIAVVVVNLTVIHRTQSYFDTAIGIDLICNANQLVDTSLNTMWIDRSSPLEYRELAHR